MTREEQIHNYAYNNCITEDADDNSYSLIVDAIKWADETIIERACEWWEQRQGDYDLRDAWSGDCVSFKGVIMDFREAMEN